MKQYYIWSPLKSFLKKIDRMVFSSFSDHFVKILEKECVDNCKSLLDIGCGGHSSIHRFSKKIEYTVGIDIFEPAIQESKKLNIHNEYKVMECKDIEKEFRKNSFDCVCAIDVIEHLSKEDGWKLIDSMEKIAKKKVIISTPNGFLPQGIYYNNPFQIHLSGWDLWEMRNKGYRIIGIGGFKFLKGEVGKVKWRPKFFWHRIGLLSQSMVASRPSWAFEILCIKDLLKNKR